MPTVRVDHVSKRFTLRHDRPRSLQELFLNVLHFKRAQSKEEYWALYDVSLEVEPGEMLGIIGENGAGKSTLLKLLSRIIEPTSGQIELDGRVGALLELGAGFHPDLTGRENIYLNGSILGFSKTEMRRLFDRIVSFSEMERFIDVQVRHYSSGMFMRLGFSVAIHLRPNILLVDEVLAVGDEAFQLRCLDRINKLKRQGVTIVFVTHDLGTVRKMCDRAIWLDDGRIQADGSVDHVLAEYRTQILADDSQMLLQTEAIREEKSEIGNGSDAWRWGSRQAEIVRVELLDSLEQERRSFTTGETFVARMHYTAHQRIQNPLFGVALHREDGMHICGPNTGLGDYAVESILGDGYIDFIIPSLPLLPGTFLFSAAIYDSEGKLPYDHHHQAYKFRVSSSAQTQQEQGTVQIPYEWRLGKPTTDDARDSHGEIVIQ